MGREQAHAGGRGGFPVGRGDAAGFSTDLLSKTMNMIKHDWNRRDFLKTAGAATLGALAAGAPRQSLAADQPAIQPTADTVIVLWMAGGMASTETFDPKSYYPFKKGMSASRMLSTFP